MTMKTRFITILAAVFCCCTALHAQVIDSGKLLGDQSWTLTADGTLTVSGTGEVRMDDIPVWTSADKFVFEEGITSVKVDEYIKDTVISISLPSTIIDFDGISRDGAYILFFNAREGYSVPVGYELQVYTRTVVLPYGITPCDFKGRIIRTDDFEFKAGSMGYVSVHVSTPGTLADEISKSGLTAEEITSITISGTLGDEDFAFLRDGLPSLFACDLSVVSVTSLSDGLFKDTEMLRCLLPKSLTSIPDSLFYGTCMCDRVSIPSSVTSIGNYAFTRSSALYGDYAQVIPSGLESFGKGAFQSCRYLKGKVTIPDGMTDIPDWAFSGCGITDITIPESVDHIGDAAFASCPISDITIPGSISSIGWGTFAYCNELTEVSIPNAFSSVSIGDSAFFECSKLSSLSIPKNIGSVGNYAFYKCELLPEISFSEEATTIGESALRGCFALPSITVPESVTKIGDWAFGNCYALTSVFIPEGVMIEGNPFSYGYTYNEYAYPHLKSLIIRSDIDAEDAEFDFFAADSLRVIEVPANMLNVNRDGLGFTRPAFDSVTVTAGSLDYKGFEFLTLCRSTLRYINLSKAENTELPDEALAECYRADSIALPANLERVGYAAFRGCMALKSIDIPASVTEIDDNAFEDCRSITAINFGGTEGSTAEAGRASAPAAQSELRRIGNWAFYNCHQLQHLVIPEGVTEIGDAAFYGCTYLEDLELPSTVTRIGDNCFALCSKLKQIRVRAAVPPEIEAKTFYDVNREIPVYVPEGYLDDYREDPYWREFNLVGEEHGETVGTDRTSVSGLYHMEDGRIVLTEEMPVSVYAATGALVYSGMATEVALPAPGVYILRIGGETVKVVRP